MGTGGVSGALAFKAWWQPSFWFALSGGFDFRSREPKFGLTFGSENYGNIRYAASHRGCSSCPSRLAGCILLMVNSVLHCQGCQQTQPCLSMNHHGQMCRLFYLTLRWLLSSTCSNTYRITSWGLVLSDVFTIGCERQQWSLYNPPSHLELLFCLWPVVCPSPVEVLFFRQV